MLCLLCSKRHREKAQPKRNDYTPATLNKIDNLEAVVLHRDNEIHFDNASMSKSSLSNHSKYLNENSENSLYRSKFSSTDDSGVHTPSSITRHPAMMPLMLDYNHSEDDDGDNAVRRQEELSSLLTDVLQPHARQPVMAVPRHQMPLPDLPHDDEDDDPNGSALIFGSVATRGPHGDDRLHDKSPSPTPPAYPPRNPAITGMALPDDGPKMTTFKPEPEMEELDPSWLQNKHNPQARASPDPWMMTYYQQNPKHPPYDQLPRQEPPYITPAYIAPHQSRDPRDMPESHHGHGGHQGHLQPQSHAGPTPSKPQTLPRMVPPPRHKVVPRSSSPKPQRSMVKDSRTPEGKNDPAATQNLLEYCDSLIADLEKVANS